MFWLFGLMRFVRFWVFILAMCLVAGIIAPFFIAFLFFGALLILVY
jgi:hypothetical protein